MTTSNYLPLLNQNSDDSDPFLQAVRSVTRFRKGNFWFGLAETLALYRQSIMTPEHPSVTQPTAARSNHTLSL